MQSIKLAKVLHGAGIRQNDVISILAENRIEYAWVSYATMFLNAIVAPTNIAYTKSKYFRSISTPGKEF